MRFSPIWRGAGVVLGGEQTSPPIGEALAFHAFDDDRGALAIGHAASVVAQIELAAVAAKVSLAHVMIGADHAALENGEEVFGGVAML